MSSGRERLLDAAERLFVDRGFEDISQQQILNAAGQRNQSAIQYHFGGMPGLRAAVFERGLLRVNRRRVELLDLAELGGRSPTIHDVVDAMILPLAEYLESGEAGRRYLQHISGAMRDPGVRTSDMIVAHNDGLQRAHALLRRLLPDLPAAVLAIRLYTVTWTVVGGLSEWSAKGQHPERTRTFVADLRRMVVAMFTAPPPGPDER
ncbi:MAG: helix-turn-helix domain-containing protein [Pseudomonadota bacterium]|nr:helix-turn-helix domain-containing protein [Pseudomonadota bacterium]